MNQRHEISLEELRVTRIGIAVGGFIFCLLCSVVAALISGERLIAALGLLIGVTFGVVLYMAGDPKYMF